MEDDTDAALDKLAEMGYSGGIAVDALLRAGGDVLVAANLIAEDSEGQGGCKKGGKKSRRGKKGTKQALGSSDASTASSNSNRSGNKTLLETDEGSDDSQSRNKKGGRKKGQRGNAGSSSQELTFREKRLAEIEARKAKRDARQVCRVCGGPHPRKECPGVMDGGRGQSRWHDQAARKKDGKERRKQEAKEEDSSALLSVGLWTADAPYYDGFADLHAVFLAQQKELGKKSSSGDSTSPLLSPQRSPQGTAHLGAGGPTPFALDDSASVEHASISDWRPPVASRGHAASTTPRELQDRPTWQTDDHVDMVAPTASLFALWVEDWARLQAVVPDVAPSVSTKTLPHQKLKKELLSTRLMKLQERAYDTPGVSNADVAAAVESNDPKGALAQLILAAPQPDQAPRTVATEWPGYRGGLASFSVMSPAATDALSYLLSLTFATPDSSEAADADTDRTSSACSVRALLAVPPAEMARWMVFDAPTQHNTNDEDGTITLVGGESIGIVEANAEHTDEIDSSLDAGCVSKEEPIDMTVVVREAEQAEVEIKRTETLLAAAKQDVIAAQQKGNRAAATAAVERLSRLLATQRARAASTAAGSEEWLATASSARLSNAVSAKLNEAIAQIPGITVASCASVFHQEDKRIVGVSCGLDYRTPEAVHPSAGPAVREAQRAACLLAINAAVDAELPLVLECHDAPSPELNMRPVDVKSSVMNSDPDLEPEPESESQPTTKLIESASKDLVKLLAQAAPPSTTLILRCGSLTTASKPGLPKLMQVWPKLFVGMSSALTYSKCPKALLDTAYDIPLDRLILTSESPNALPAVLGGTRRAKVSIPPHVACAAEHMANIKAGTFPGLSREAVLNQATQNLCNVFGLPVLDAEASTSLQSTPTTATMATGGDGEGCDDAGAAKVFMKKPNSGPLYV